VSSSEKVSTTTAGDKYHKTEEIYSTMCKMGRWSLWSR